MKAAADQICLCDLATRENAPTPGNCLLGAKVSSAEIILQGMILHAARGCLWMKWWLQLPDSVLLPRAGDRLVHRKAPDFACVTSGLCQINVAEYGISKGTGVKTGGFVMPVSIKARCEPPLNVDRCSPTCVCRAKGWSNISHRASAPLLVSGLTA